MPSLHSLQREFAAALLDEGQRTVCRHIEEGGFTAQERLGIYRNSFLSVLVASLRLTYPAVNRLVGHEFFEEAARRFVQASLPSSACLNEYGEHFADFLAGFDPAGTLPYLPDVARFEWALSFAANADDSPVLQIAALAGVDASQHAALRFRPHPSLRILALDYPADHIVDSVLSGNEEAMREVDLESGPIRLAVHRGFAGIETQRLDATAFEFLGGLCDGRDWGWLVAKAGDRASALLAEQFVKGRVVALEAGRGPKGYS